MDNSDAGLPTGKLSEAEWLISLNAGELIGHLAVTGRLRTREGDRAGERKLRLFGVACCRSLQHWSNLPLVPSTIDAAEQFADGD
ncbi:hypothetical protein R5W24_006654, partial [Gemmata sp. JC717]|nr:hypothetical protein [Gemmata algarum]